MCVCTTLLYLVQVVCVKKSWQSNDNKTSLVTNEVLFIKSVQRSLFTKKGIRLVSLTTKSDKFLTEDCSANFTTQPSLCKLHITDIIEHIKQPKGEQCLLFINSQVNILKLTMIMNTYTLFLSLPLSPSLYPLLSLRVCVCVCVCVCVLGIYKS